MEVLMKVIRLIEKAGFIRGIGKQKLFKVPILFAMMGGIIVHTDMRDIITATDAVDVISDIFKNRPVAEIYGDYAPRYSQAFINMLLQKEGHKIWHNVEFEFYSNLIECALASLQLRQAQVKMPESTFLLINNKEFHEAYIQAERTQRMLKLFEFMLQAEHTKCELGMGRVVNKLYPYDMPSSEQRTSVRINVPAWVIVTSLQWALPGIEITEEERRMSGGSDAGISRIRFTDFGADKWITLTFGIDANDRGRVLVDAPPLWRHPYSSTLFDIIQRYDLLYEYFKEHDEVLPDNELSLCSEHCVP
jgi:hypothetical protein